MHGEGAASGLGKGKRRAGPMDERASEATGKERYPESGGSRGKIALLMKGLGHDLRETDQKARRRGRRRRPESAATKEREKEGSAKAKARPERAADASGSRHMWRTGGSEKEREARNKRGEDAGKEEETEGMGRREEDQGASRKKWEKMGKNGKARGP